MASSYTSSMTLRERVTDERTATLGRTEGVSFHEIPSRQDRRELWLKVLSRENIFPQERTVVCSQHFKDSDFLLTLKNRRLRPDAVPSIFNVHSMKKISPVVKRKGNKVELETTCDRKLRRSVTASERSQDSSDNSSRETKRARKNGAKKGEFRGAKFDSSGIHKESQKDLCDCLNVECPGCFMTCPRCASTKCGHECRRNRRWIYEGFDIEGTNLTIKNKFKK